MPSRHMMKSISEAATAKGMSFFTVDLLMAIGATMAEHPTISMTLKMFDPTTLPTARSGLPFSADTKLTNSSGAEVPAATIVSPMTISGMCMPRASDAAPSVRRSAPHTTRAMPMMM